MKCRVSQNERWPTMILDVREPLDRQPDAQTDLPPNLINALQVARTRLNKAERDILEYLRDRGSASEEELAWLAELEQDLMS
jgi:hypothetical protein